MKNKLFKIIIFKYVILWSGGGRRRQLKYCRRGFGATAKVSDLNTDVSKVNRSVHVAYREMYDITSLTLFHFNP